MGKRKCEHHDRDDIGIVPELRALIRSKRALEKLYDEAYDKYRATIEKCPKEGVILELGSGAGFASEKIPDLVTSEVVPCQGVERVVDATQMPFTAGELKAILMLNVFHHIPDVSRFLCEAERCLKPGGRILILDQHFSWFSRFIFSTFHHEPFDPRTPTWSFSSKGRLSSANGALAWIVFVRDRLELEKKHPGLSLVRYVPHSPLRYWLVGGLTSVTLIPGWAFGMATALDRLLARLCPFLCCFAEVELVRK